jgi:hypothetical protein
VVHPDADRDTDGSAQALPGGRSLTSGDGVVVNTDGGSIHSFLAVVTDGHFTITFVLTVVQRQVPERVREEFLATVPIRVATPSASPTGRDDGPSAIPAALANFDGSVRVASQATVEDPVGASAQRVPFFVATTPTLPPFADRRPSDNAFAARLVPVVGTDHSRDAFLLPSRDGFVTGAPASLHGTESGPGLEGPAAQTPADATRASTPPPDVPDGAAPATTTPGVEPSPPPKTAGLLTDALPFGLAALERAVRALTAPQADDDRGAISFWHWLGLSSGFAAAALGFAAARRRGAAPVPAERGVHPEDVP